MKKEQNGALRKSAMVKRKALRKSENGDAYAKKIRKHIKGVVDVKRGGPGVYEVAIA